MARAALIEDTTDVDVETTISSGLSELLTGARRVKIVIDYGWDEDE